MFIRKEQIEFLRELRFSWTKIAALFSVSRRTLFSVRAEYGLVDLQQFTDISDQELDASVTEIKTRMPDSGQNIVRGVLRAQGIHVPLPRVQESISRIDPVNTALRWAEPISRRIYSVASPNALWHMDGTHKLMR